MRDYVIFTDSSCDLSQEEIKKRGIGCLELTFRFDGEDKEYSNYEMPISNFYSRMREGGIAKTAAVNTEVFKDGFEDSIKKGLDILYIGFSSGLSTTCNSARIAMTELKEQYPDAKLISVDTLAASAGIALLIDMVLDKKRNGATIEEAAQFAEDNKMKIAQRFTVDDLVYLKRGGRVSAATALVGNLLGIKPVLHVDNEGHLVSIGKVRGRHASLVSLADKLGETAIEDTRVYISHSDCYDDAVKLSEIIMSKYGYEVQLITDVGPVIGAHSGPGTMALFFVASER